MSRASILGVNRASLHALIRYRAPLVLLLLLLSAAGARAQALPLQASTQLAAAPVTGLTSSSWNLARLLQAALDSHPLMLGRRSAQDAARADREGAEWARYPTPSIEAFSRSSLGSNGVARLEQPLFTGGRISANIDAASRRLDAAGSALEEARLDLRLRVANATVEALRQQARLTRARESVDEHRKLLDLIQRRVRQEVSSSVDQSLTESRLYQALNEQSAVAQSLRNALASLTQLAGQNVTQIEAEGTADRNAPPSRELAGERARNYSPALQRLDYEEAAATADIDVRRAALYPNLALRLERAMGSLGESRALLVLQAQPGAGLSAMSGVQAAQARREAARQSREAALRDLDERVSTDWNELEAARLRLQNAEQSQMMSSEVFASYTRQYVIGRKSWLDVLNAVREAAQAQFAVEDARAQALGASLRLRALTGTLQTP